MYKITFINCIKHLKTILKHKFWVFYYCCKAGIPFQGFIHDFSKFSPIEFFESVKYYTGTHSPIDECKKVNGVSYAWLHHKGRNKHHYEYWQDNFDKGGNPIKMPYKYLIEEICDFLGAGRAYNGKSFSYEKEYTWWINKIKNPIAMHPQDKDFINTILFELQKNSIDFNPKWLKEIYIKIKNERT